MPNPRWVDVREPALPRQLHTPPAPERSRKECLPFLALAVRWAFVLCLCLYLCCFLLSWKMWDLLGLLRNMSELYNSEFNQLFPELYPASSIRGYLMSSHGARVAVHSSLAFPRQHMLSNAPAALGFSFLTSVDRNSLIYRVGLFPQA